ncbi:hypothetical protein phiK7B1_099 [Pseudomonas phage phiK7B1]|uniref:Uncharacterized protein n=1 Tax=Pseudomonas phage Nican01 TaxID=3138540 RepID=A0AAU6W0M6_9CAUD|nr:hypothetical protein phiK7B1_099 [Pseudomonas phage phiK7B1]
MSTEKCNEDIYKHGESVGLMDVSKTEAEAHCQRATAESKTHDYDWHYVAGRVHVKRLPKNWGKAEGHGEWA